MGTTGLTQNNYFIGVDPCDKNGDHTAIWIKIPGDDIIEILNVQKDIEHMQKTIYAAFGVNQLPWNAWITRTYPMRKSL